MAAPAHPPALPVYKRPALSGAAEHAARTDALNRWVSDVMGYSNPFTNFLEDIRDGTVLCLLLNRIKAGSVKVSQIIQDPSNQDECYSNLQLFLKSCINVGVPITAIVMKPQSLSEDVVSSASHLSAGVRMKRQKLVIKTLYAVAAHSCHFKFTKIVCDGKFGNIDNIFERDDDRFFNARRNSLSSDGSDEDEEQESAKSTAKSVKKKPPHVSAPYDGYANDNIKALREKKQRKQAAGLKGN